jgi:hypothetical protein
MVNDRAIKNFNADWNYLLFLKIRYFNSETAEEEEPSLPPGWRVRRIGGVTYRRDPTGQHVFNSNELVEAFLRQQGSPDFLEHIESDPDSELSEWEEEEEDGEGEGIKQELV